MTAEIEARRADLEWRLVGQEIVILDLRLQSYLSLNPSGAVLWPLVVAGTSRQDLIDALVTTYGLDGADAAADVDLMVTELAEAHLLESSDASTHGR